MPPPPKRKPPVRGLRIDPRIISFEFTPSVGILARNLDRLGLDIRSFREPLTRAVKQVMIPSIRKNFDQEGRPAWEELAESTIEIRGESGPILNRTGNLKRNMGFMSIWTITKEYAIIKDLPQRIWYGKVHQAGVGTFAALVAKHGGDVKEALQHVGHGGEKKANVPPRPFVVMQEEDAVAIQKVFEDWLEERLNRALGR